MGAPRVPPLNPSESIVLSEHYRLSNYYNNDYPEGSNSIDYLMLERKVRMRARENLRVMNSLKGFTQFIA